MKEQYKDAYNYIVDTAPMEDKPVLKEFLAAIYSEQLDLVGMLFVKYDSAQRAVLKKHGTSITGAANQTKMKDMISSVEAKIALLSGPDNNAANNAQPDYLTDIQQTMLNMPDLSGVPSVDNTDMPRRKRELGISEGVKSVYSNPK